MEATGLVDTKVYRVYQWYDPSITVTANPTSTASFAQFYQQHKLVQRQRVARIRWFQENKGQYQFPFYAELTDGVVTKSHLQEIAHEFSKYNYPTATAIGSFHSGSAITVHLNDRELIWEFEGCAFKIEAGRYYRILQVRVSGLLVK